MAKTKETTVKIVKLFEPYLIKTRIHTNEVALLKKRLEEILQSNEKEN